VGFKKKGGFFGSFFYNYREMWRHFKEVDLILFVWMNMKLSADMFKQKRCSVIRLVFQWVKISVTSTLNSFKTETRVLNIFLWKTDTHFESKVRREFCSYFSWS